MTIPDELTLDDFVTVRDKDRPVVKIGLSTTLFFHGAHEPIVREAVLAVLEDYLRLCGDRIRWRTRPPKYIWAKADAGLPAEIEARIRSTPADTAWQFTFHGGERSDEASDFRMESLGSASWQDAMGHLSYITAAFPIDFFGGRDEGFIPLVCRWADALKPLHGYGGLGILDAFSGGTPHEPIVFSVAQQFPGLDVNYPTVHSFNCTDGIKGVNWLTVVGDSLLPRLDGVDAVETQAGSDFAFHRYQGGVVIQAGRQPQGGDRNRDRWPELYIRLNALLKPIRAERTTPFQHYGPHRFDLEHSDGWLRRFDR